MGGTAPEGGGVGVGVGVAVNVGGTAVAVDVAGSGVAVDAGGTGVAVAGPEHAGKSRTTVTSIEMKIDHFLLIITTSLSRLYSSLCKEAYASTVLDGCQTRSEGLEAHYLPSPTML